MSPSSPKESSPIRSRRQTKKKLKNAIDQLCESGSKVSISAVAKAADVTPALIHNTYPDIAERIRGVIGNSTRSQRDEKQDALMKERERNRELRAEVERLRHEAAKLASINLTLMSKLAVFAEISKGKLVSFVHPELEVR